MLLATARERSSTLESAVRDRYMAAVARGPPSKTPGHGMRLDVGGSGEVLHYPLQDAEETYII